MKEVIVKRYAGLLMEWSRSVDTPENVGRYFEKFRLKAAEFAGVGGVLVCFDERAAQSAMRLLDTLKLQNFHRHLHSCKPRETLGLIGQELYCQGFISNKHCLQIREKIQQCMLIHRIEPFLHEINELQTASMHEIRLLWNRHIAYEIQDFWLWIIKSNIKLWIIKSNIKLWIIKSNIKHQTLVLIFEVTVRMNQRLCPEVIRAPLFKEIRIMYESSNMDKLSPPREHSPTLHQSPTKRI